MKQQAKPTRRAAIINNLGAAGTPSSPVEAVSESSHTPPANGISNSSQTEDILRLFDNHPVPMWVSNLKTLAFLAVNRAMLEMYGYTRDEFLKMTLEEIYLQEDTPRLQKAMRHKKPDTHYSGLWSHRRKDGTVIDVEVTSQIVNHEGRQAALVVTKDVTGQKRVEEALRRSEEKYRALVENINDVHFAIDAQGCFTYISPVIERFARYRADEIIGQPFTRFIHPDDLPSVGASFERTLTGNLEPLEFRIYARDGAVLHVRTSSRPLMDAGQLVGLTGVMVDITDRKRVEEALQKAHAELEQRVEERTADLARANRMLNILSACNQTVVRATDEAALLQEICQIIVDLGGYPLVWVGFAENDAAKTVRPVAQAGFEEGYLDSVNIAWADNEHGQGPTGRAIRSGEPCIARDTQTDSSYTPWRGEAVRRGYASSIALPLRANDWVFGALNIYAPVPDAFQDEEVFLLMELAGDLAFGITSLRERAAHNRTEESLKESEMRYRAIVEAFDGLIYICSPDYHIEFMNKQLVARTGYDGTGELCYKVLHDRDSICPWCVNDRVFTGEIVGWELQSPKDDRWYYIVNTPIYHTDGSMSKQAMIQDITRRKRAEEQLRRLVELQSAILNNAAYMVISTDGEGVITTFNPAAERALGYTAEECIGKLSPVAFHDPDEMAERARIFSAELSATIEPGFEVFAAKARRYLPNEHVWTHIRKDGSHFPVLLSVTALFDPQGNITGFLGIASDITERTKAEKELEESEERWRSLVEYHPTGSAIHSEGKIIYVNKVCMDIAGAKSKEELIGRQILDFVHPDSRPMVIERVKYMMETGQYGKPTEEKFLKLNGESIDVEVTAIPIKYMGKPAIQTVIWDITERKRAEESLWESSQMLKLVLDNMPAFVFWKDLSSVYLGCNNLFAANAGLSSPEEIIGLTDLDLPWKYTEAESYRADDRMVMETGIPKLDYEETQLTADGHITDVRTSKIPLRNPEGDVIGVLGTFEDITERKQAERIRKTLYEISQAVISTDKLEDLYRSIHSILGTLMPVDNFFIALYDQSSGLISYPYYVDQFDTIPAPGKPERGLTEYVLRTGSALLASPEVFNALVEQNEVELIGSPSIDWLGAPLRGENRIIGVMAVQSYTERVRYGTKELHIMEFVSTQVAMAIERKRSFEEIQQHLQRLNALRAIDMALTSSFDLRSNLNTLLEQVLAQLAVHAADVLLLDPYTLTLEYAAGRGFRTRTVEAVHIRLGESFAGRVALERRAVKLDDAVLSKESPQFAALWADESFAAYCAVPLITKGQIKGVMEIFHRAPLVMDPDRISFLETLAGQAAIGIENAHLFEHLQRSNVDLALAYDATIEGWSKALDLRDMETEGHTLRVTEMTLQLARTAGMTDEELVHVRRGALLHDIGKMGIPDSILLKPGPLTDEEWDIMRRHPKYAYEMLSPIAYLRASLDIPYCHHEKWDGTGYPRGLKGEQIPLAARLFAVIDVYDALISRRPYRDAWSREKTIGYIESLAGNHFDPKVARLFLEKMRSSTF